MNISNLTNKILQGNSIEILKTIPDKSIDLIFADPPYFMQTEGVLLRTNGTKFSGVEDEWDKFSDYIEYDNFTTLWLKECKRVLKDNGSIWVIGSFQNIYRLGYIMQNLGFWILNDLVWNKNNPVPNFGGTRFCNAHETMLWCSKSKKSKYTFNYKTMKYLNNNKQERSVWNLSICNGSERIKDDNNVKVHSTQKPELLLEKIILSSTKVDDVVLDPFFGTGTTGAIAKKLGRNYIGIEIDKKYIDVAEKRIEKVKTIKNEIYQLKLEKKPPKVPMNKLIEKKYIFIDEILYNKDNKEMCRVNSDGNVYDDSDVLSIHKMSAKVLNKVNNNGWDYFYILRDKKLISINDLRYKYESEINKNE